MASTLREKKSKLMKVIKNFGKLTLKRILLSKHFHLVFKGCTILVVLLAIFYGAYLYINRSVGNDVVVSKSEIIARVGKLIPVPLENPEAVVRVEDPEILKKQNDFYQNVKAGDYVLIYPSEAIIYDLMNNSIVSVKKMER